MIYKNPDVMIDLETLSTKANATIVSIAAVRFDSFKNYLRTKTKVSDLESINLLINIDDQNRDIDPNTVEWWGQQDQVIVERVFAEKNRMSLANGLKRLAEFTWNPRRVWCQGTDFDVSILRHAYEENNMKLPWEYWKSRDSRTILDIVEVELERTTHDPLEDCFRQIIGVQVAFEKLGILKFIR
jgi:3' exoribonuclease, RNase T-like